MINIKTLCEDMESFHNTNGRLPQEVRLRAAEFAEIFNEQAAFVAGLAPTILVAAPTLQVHLLEGQKTIGFILPQLGIPVVLEVRGA